ncbi:MAG: fumarylacetoacetate hydrolase family protein [Chloroflexi bacterium]|nr:fumarylacetoacetate hydrolase family protein [Chloroflexota bacterium]
MRILRYRAADGPAWGTLVDGSVHALDGDPYGDCTAGRPVGPLEAVDLLAPCEPRKVICVGLNYAAHAAETGMAAPEFPMFFLKPHTAIANPGDPILLPTISDHVEHECELVVVIGRRARNVSESEALDYVLGYTCGNDVSARDWQGRESQWFRGKGFDSFFPFGPWIETDLDPFDLAIATRVNGEVRQSASTSDLIFDVPYLVADASRTATLLPGDVIATGTPAGVAPIVAGDVVDIEIGGVGVLSNPVRNDR